MHVFDVVDIFTIAFDFLQIALEANHDVELKKVRCETELAAIEGGVKE